jgi:hypothetical protein
MTDSVPSFRLSRALSWGALVGALLVLVAGVAVAFY